jgi:hypothetical protein
MPEVVAFFEKIAADPQAQQKKLPRIIGLTPAVTGGPIDPATKELSIDFDRGMSTSGYSFVGDQSQMPKLTGKPWFSSDGKSLVLPVKLQPGKRYTLRLNSLQHHGFTSAAGFALEPTEISFTTAAN